MATSCSSPSPSERLPGTFRLNIRRFAADEWQLYRDLRLRALEESPDAFGSTYEHELQQSDEQWATRLARAAGSAQDLPLVAEVDGEPSALAWVRIDEGAPSVAHLYQMWVAPTRRRHGVGRAMLDAAIAWVRAAGARAMVLDVTCGNDDAVGLYESVGFTLTGERKPLRPGSALQSQSMRLVLTSDGHMGVVHCRPRARVHRRDWLTAAVPRPIFAFRRSSTTARPAGRQHAG